MRYLTSLSLACAAGLAGCAKSDRAADSTPAAAADTTHAAAPAASTTGAAGTVSLADVAGKWNVRSVPETGPDTSATTYVLTATADTTGWKVTFPSGLTVPARVRVSGDSIVTDIGPFASQRRKGMQVTTNGAFRRQGDRLAGWTVAHYKTARADSVLRLRTEGTRAP